MLSTWATSRKIAAAAVLVALVVIVGVLAGRSSGGADAATGGGATSAGDAGTGGSGSAGAGAGGASAGGAASMAGGAGSDRFGISAAPDTAPMPVQYAVDHVDGLHDLDEVQVDASAEDGKAIYGVEMRLCKGGAVIANDGDWIPNYTGQCTSDPLSPGGDGYKIVTSEDGNETVHTTFRVTTGTAEIPLEDGGSTARFTCDADHPCVLAVKYQFTDGFGFRTFPLTFAR